MAREVTLVDAGLGNLGSVERALSQVGAAVHVTEDPDRVAASRMVVFPGQGAFSPATTRLVEGAMGAALRMVIERGDPFLGICLGMQLLFDGSDEGGGQPGMGVLPGRCRRFPFTMTEPSWTEPPLPEPQPPAPQQEEPNDRAPTGGESGNESGATAAGDANPPIVTPRRLKVPHMGWNDVEPTGDHYYFVHSYYVDAARSEDVMWMTTYGTVRFAAAVRTNNVLGCQFHPEKSQRAGLKFLRAFLLGGWT